MTMLDIRLSPTDQRPKPAFLDGEAKQLLIGGTWVPAISGRTIDAVDPTTQQTIASFAAAGPEDVDSAVAAARLAFTNTEWSGIGPDRRGRLLLQISELLERHADELAELESLDMGGPLGLTTWMVQHAAEVFRHYAGWPTKIYGQTAPSDPSHFNYTLRQPHGVVAGVYAWNGPLLQMSYKAAPALATGNTVVLKPAEAASLTTLRFGELLAESELPPGVVNIITGYGAEAGEALVTHRDVDKVTFTGSGRVGRHILEMSTNNLKRVTLELGGKSPTIVFADADLNAAAAAAAVGFCAGSGQGCVAGSRILVQESVRDQFIDLLVKEMAAYTLGDPFHPEAAMGPMVTREHFQRVSSYVELARDEGATVMVSGTVPDAGGLFIAPTLLTDVTMDMRVVQEEIFGPVAALMSFSDVDQAIALGNDVPYGLASSVWTRDLSTAHLVAARLQAGTVWINTYGEMSAGILPFGGFKQSGIGREHGTQVLDAFTETKSVVVQL